MYRQKRHGSPLHGTTLNATEKTPLLTIGGLEKNTVRWKVHCKKMVEVTKSVNVTTTNDTDNRNSKCKLWWIV